MEANKALLHWNSAAGRKVSRHTEAVRVDRGTLYVEVDNTVWMHQLQMEEAELRDRLNRELKAHEPGQEPVRQIRFRLGSCSLSTGHPN